MSARSQNIEVAVRIRPSAAKSVWKVLRRERADGDGKAYCLRHAAAAAAGGDKKDYVFDSVFGPKTTQEEVYERAVRGVVSKALGGFNGTVFAYGSTGSGKTHSVMGTADDPGIIPRAVEQVFQTCAAGQGRKYMVMVSYMEIYKEHIRDLLDPNAPADQSLEVREMPDGSFTVPQLTVESISSRRNLLRRIRRGSAHRMVSATTQNAVSSRSHAVLTLTVESACEQTGEVTVSKLNLVDLAGSERYQAQGDGRQQETKAINQSLHCLSRVIHVLSEQGRARGGKRGKGRKRARGAAPLHVPYRDSNLTRVLKDALGGNAVTLMLACMHPDADNVTETVSTLGYALRSKSITNVVSKNEARRSMIERLKGEVRKLSAMSQANEQVQRTLVELASDYQAGREAELLNSLLELLHGLPAHTGDAADAERRSAAARNVREQLDALHFATARSPRGPNGQAAAAAAAQDDESDDQLPPWPSERATEGRPVEEVELYDMPPHKMFQREIVGGFCANVARMAADMSSPGASESG